MFFPARHDHWLVQTGDGYAAHIAGAIGLKAAVDWVEDIGLSRIHAHEQALVGLARDALGGDNRVQLFGPADSAGILSFVNAWDEFLLALSLNSSPGMRTLPVGITLYQTEFVFPWPVISAALVVAIVPIAVLIAVFQERVVGGLTQGGLKG